MYVWPKLTFVSFSRFFAPFPEANTFVLHKLNERPPPPPPQRKEKPKKHPGLDKR